MPIKNHLKISILLLIIVSVFMVGCVQPPQQTFASPSPDATFIIDDITDDYPYYLNEKSGFYDAFCSRGCSSEDPISKQRVDSYSDMMGATMHSVSVFFVTTAKIDTFRMGGGIGLPDNYVIRSEPYIVPNSKDRNKYVYRVRVDYIPRLEKGSIMDGTMRLSIIGLIDDNGFSMPFDIIINREAKVGFSYRN